jgi:hypothetical protein
MKCPRALAVLLGCVLLLVEPGLLLGIVAKRLGSEYRTDHRGDDSLNRLPLRLT